MNEATVATVLWALLGWSGAHRLYLGWTRSGVLFLCTFGLCGLGWFADAFVLRSLIRQTRRRRKQKPVSAASESGSSLSVAAPSPSTAKEEEEEKDKGKAPAPSAHREESHRRREKKKSSAGVEMMATNTAHVPMDSSLLPTSLSAAASPAPAPPSTARLLRSSHLTQTATAGIGGGGAAPPPPPPPPAPAPGSSELPPPPQQRLSAAAAVSQTAGLSALPLAKSATEDGEKEKELAEAQAQEALPSKSEEESKMGDKKKKKKEKKSGFLQFDLDNVFRSLAMWMPWCKVGWVFALLLFLTLVGCSLWLLLPAFFLLLLLATTHIEETSDQMVERHEVLRTETTTKRGARWIRLLLLSTPITLVFGGFPAIIVWLLPRYGEHAYWIGVVAQTAVILGFVLLGVVRNLARIRVRERLKLTSTSQLPVPIGMRNFRNWIVWFSLLYETIQLATYPFMKPAGNDLTSEELALSSSSSFSGGPNLIAGVVIPAIFLTLKKHVWLLGASMGPAVTFALVLLFCAEVTADLVHHRKSLLNGESKEGHENFFRSFTGSVAYGHGYLRDVSPVVSTLFDLLANTLFMTASSQMISQFSCAFESQCFIKHAAATYISLVCFSFFAPLAILTGPMLMEGSQRKKDMRWAEGFLMAVAMVKMLLLLITAFSASYLVRVWAALVAAVLLFTVTFVSSQKVKFMTRPCAQPMGNIWRCASYAIFFVACIYCLISTKFPVLSATSLSIAIAVIALIVLAVIPCFVAEVFTWKQLKSERGN